MLGIFSAITRGISMLRNLIGQPFREWSEWAATNPKAAAEQLDLVAGVLWHRANAIAARRGDKPWAVRRDRALSKALREHAGELRDQARAMSGPALENRCRAALRAA